jgi:hypothetical protein
VFGVLEPQQGVLVGHGCPAKPGAVIPHVLGVVNPVIAQGLALWPGAVVAGHDADGAPVRASEGTGEGQALAGSEVVVALLVVEPQTRKQRAVR